MDFAEYEKEGHRAYLKLAETIANILDVVVKGVPDLRVQQIQHRAKATDSLRLKLQNRNILTSDTIESEIKDLAGCRVILYTNADVARLVSSREIRDNFDVDWDRTKFHYPGDGATAGEFFISYNYVLKLKEQRVALPEYSVFRDKWCEVQVQTTLDHAWSEMAHDTIYKPAGDGFGSLVMKDVEKRMAAIMQRYLLPAGFDFQKVANDVQSLRIGRQLYENDPLKLFGECRDNNERYELLDQFKEHVLPYYDDIKKTAPDIRACMVSLIRAARSTEVTSTQYGFEGYTVEYVVDSAFDIIDRLRFTHDGAIEATFEAICELFPGAKSQGERKRISESAERLAKHNLTAWRQVGPLVQEILVSRIRQVTPDEEQPIRGLIVDILGHVLQPEVSGTSNGYNSVTFHQGQVHASEALRRVRSAAIEKLQDLFLTSLDDRARRSVVNALSKATRLTHQAKTTADLLKIVLGDTLQIVKFYTSIAGSQSYEILQRLEHDLLWLYRHKRKLTPDFDNDTDIAKARDELLSAIFAFRDRVNHDHQFVIYKTLVGFQSVFPPAWDGDAFDIRVEADYRNKEISRLVDEITSANAAEWFATIRRCAQTRSDDGATFPSFRRFLEEFARKRSELLIERLNDLDEDTAAFLSSILKGFEGGSLENEMRAQVRQWIGDRRHLQQIAQYCILASKLDEALIEECLSSAILVKDSPAVLWTIEAVARRQAEVSTHLIEMAFLPGVRYLATERNFLWVDPVATFSQQGSLLQKLDEDGEDGVLQSLIEIPRIEYNEEELLSFLAENRPLKIVDFFNERLLFSQRPESSNDFEPIPFSFHNHLQPKLSPVADGVVQRVYQWYLRDDELFQFRGGAFLAHLFPDFEVLEPPLLMLVGTGNRPSIEFVLDILRAYEGQSFLHAICKEIVNALPEEDPLLGEVSVVLDSSGVVSGEFGVVAAAQRKREEMLAWLADERVRVRGFANRHIKSLDRQIAAEQRRSMEDLQLRKRQYGTSDPTVGDQSEDPS
ncbi:RelA/SpoT domain-containing protein [Mesorhizobium sp. VNQ89]|uniref:RelA/SpoT domain-containing protein n=1 Tax=Mesorhizobium quangtriensis TaxID=3157709 RepID=UPI0032B74914